MCARFTYEGSQMIRPDRYRVAARFYDVISAEPVYRAGRRIGIEQLALEPGDTVVDIGCGTGLNFSLIQAKIGPSGLLLGVDASRDMLDQADRRARAHGWDNVRLMRADATTVTPAAITDLAGGPAAAVLATYALSLMEDWPAAWSTMQAIAAPGARLAVVDMQPPVGRAALLGWLARMACWLGGSDIHARPWTSVEGDCRDVQGGGVRGGHVQIRSGRVA